MPGQPSQPKPRQWETDLVQPIMEDGAVVGLDLNRDDSHELFQDLESVLFRMGGAALIGAKREQLDDGTWVTVGYRVSVESFMPPVTRPTAETPSPTRPPAPVPVEEPEPENDPAPAADYQPAPDQAGPPPVSATDGTEPEPELALEQG